MNVFKLKISKHSIAFYKKNENPCRAPKVIILTSGGSRAAGRRAQGAAAPPATPLAPPMDYICKCYVRISVTSSAWALLLAPDCCSSTITPTPSILRMLCDVRCACCCDPAVQVVRQFTQYISIYSRCLSGVSSVSRRLACSCRSRSKQDAATQTLSIRITNVTESSSILAIKINSIYQPLSVNWSFRFNRKSQVFFFQCSDTAGWVTGMASGL